MLTVMSKACEIQRTFSIRKKINHVLDGLNVSLYPNSETGKTYRVHKKIEYLLEYLTKTYKINNANTLFSKCFIVLPEIDVLYFVSQGSNFIIFVWITIVPVSFIDQQYQFSHKSNFYMCISHFGKLGIRGLKDLKSHNLVWSLNKQGSELRLEWKPCLHPPYQHFPRCVKQSYSSLS